MDFGKPLEKRTFLKKYESMRPFIVQKFSRRLRLISCLVSNDNHCGINVVLYIFWWDMFFNSSLYFTFTWYILFFFIQFFLLNAFSFLFPRTTFFCQHKSRYWTPEINVNISMYLVPFSFCWIYSLLRMFLYDLDSLKIPLLSLLSYQVFNIASNQPDSNSHIQWCIYNFWCT